MARVSEELGALARIAFVAVLAAVTAFLMWSQTLRTKMVDRQLIDAIASGNLEDARRSLDWHGASPNAVYGIPLMLAADRGDAGMVRLLLSRGAAVDVDVMNGTTALAAASRAGNTETMLLLLAAGSNPNQCSDSGQTPLGAAAFWGKLAAVDVLLRHGADVRGVVAGVSRRPPLVEAVRMGDASPAVVRRLIDAGADVNQADDEGVRPLTVAIRGERQDLVALLRSCGARE